MKKGVNYLGPPTGTAIIALLDAGIALRVRAQSIEVLPTAGVYDLHLLFLYKAMLRGRPPDHAACFGSETV